MVLSALQIAAIAFLALQIYERDRAVESPPERTTIVAAQPGIATTDEDQLRRVVREELAAWGASIAVDRSAATPTPYSSAASIADQRAQLALVSGQLEQYRGQGFMSPAEMGSFQEELARLEPSVRKQVLSRLVRAMNAGEIRGEL